MLHWAIGLYTYLDGFRSREYFYRPTPVKPFNNPNFRIANLPEV